MLTSAFTPTDSPLFWLWLAALLWPVLWGSILLHEAGHLLAGWIAGYHIAAWGMGDGEPFLVLPPASRPARIRFFLCRRSPFTGRTGAIFPGLFPTRGQAASFVAGGVAINCLLALVGYALMHFGNGAVHFSLGLLLLSVNILLCLMALTPGPDRGGTLPTDGTRLAALLTPRGTHLPAASPCALIAGSRFWQTIHVPILVQLSTLAAAGAAAELGDVEIADLYLREADRASACNTPALDAYTALMHGLRCEAADDLDQAAASFRKARTIYQAQGHQVAACMADIYLAALSVEALKDLSADAVVRRFPVLETLVAFRALLAVSTDDTAADALLATALSRYQTARLFWRSDTQDARVFPLVARALTRRGDRVGAATLQEQARRAADRVESALGTDSAACAAFRRRMTTETV